MNTPEEALPPEYAEFVDVFSEEQASILPENTAHNYMIDLKEGT
jgi:patatin-like phospholipase/acyl hydrolase